MIETMEKLIKSKIREIPDWPKKGVNFKDITPLIEDSKAFRKVIDALAKPYLGRRIDPVKSRKAGISPKAKLFNRVDKIVGIDARGFIIAAALAYKLKSGVAIVRKKGKLPSRKISKKYALEYGSNTIEMHKDTILAGEKVLLVDDLLATGGTMRATIDLVEKLKGKIVGVDFLIELSFLNGRKKINPVRDSKNREKLKKEGISNGVKGYRIRSLAKYDA